MKEPVVDLELLGQQHDHFFGLTVRLQKYLARGREGQFDPAELVRMVLAFRHYAFLHFHAEEVFMIGLRFPEYFAHKDEHNQYLDRINGYLARLEQIYHAVNKEEQPAAGMLDLAEEINAFVMSWWQSHVTTIDGRYVTFSREKAA